jgi:L-ascorbate metabolism protein UlaG (beta-lactamase superfamily)
MSSGKLSGRRYMTRGIAAALAALAVAGSPALAQVRIEYVAHASFVVESPGGVRALVDPYNGTRWLGYSFPAGLGADVVLVSHYDHDASYYAPAQAPVLRTPGVYAFSDLRVSGIEGRHAEPWGQEFGGTNTLWLIETGGLRIAHLGDTGPLSEASLRALGTVDVLMLPVDDQDHILKRAEIVAIRNALRPAVTVPMHYRLAELTRLPDSLGTIDRWLAEQRNVVRLGSHATVVRERPAEAQVLVLSPSPAVKPWPAELALAFEHRSRARALSEKADGSEAGDRRAPPRRRAGAGVDALRVRARARARRPRAGRAGNGCARTGRWRGLAATTGR